MATVTWPRIRRHIQEKLDRARASLDTAVGEEVLRLQGEVRAYKALLNAPEAVGLIDQEDARAEEAQKGT